MEDQGAGVPGLDLSSAFDRASERLEVGELLRRGHRRVQVLDRRKVEELIREAVERSVASLAEGRVAVEVERVEAEARRRFEELMARHQEVLALKLQAEEALRDLAIRFSRGEEGPAPDLGPLARQVAAMGALLRGEAPAAQAAEGPIRALLETIAGKDADPADSRLDRIMYQVERLASAVEATERSMGRLLAAGGGGGRGPAPPGAPPGPGKLDLFRAILEENLRLSGVAT